MLNGPIFGKLKKMKNWIIGLKIFPLEIENSLLHVKKLQLSHYFISLLQIKNGKLLLQSGLQANEEKNLQNEPAKCKKCSENDVLNNILKPPLPHPELFYGVFNALEITFLRISRLIYIFGKKVSSESCSSLSSLSISTIIFQPRT